MESVSQSVSQYDNPLSEDRAEPVLKIPDNGQCLTNCDVLTPPLLISVPFLSLTLLPSSSG
jgi:hypothetical protein